MAGTIHGVVTRAGERVEPLRVVARHDDGRTRRTHTDAGGRFRLDDLAVGPWTLDVLDGAQLRGRANAWVFHDAVSEATVELEALPTPVANETPPAAGCYACLASPSVKDVLLDMESEPGVLWIRGTLRAHAQIVSVDPRLGPATIVIDVVLSSNGPDSANETPTGIPIRWRIGSVRTGTYGLTVRTRSVSQAAFTAVYAQLIDMRAAAPPPRRRKSRSSKQTGTLDGTIEHADGTPAKNVTITLASGPGDAVDLAPVTDATGTFSLPNLTPGRWTVQVHAPDGQSHVADVDVMPGKTTSLTLRLAP